MAKSSAVLDDRIPQRVASHAQDPVATADLEPASDQQASVQMSAGTRALQAWNREMQTKYGSTRTKRRTVVELEFQVANMQEALEAKDRELAEMAAYVAVAEAPAASGSAAAAPCCAGKTGSASMPQDYGGPQLKDVGIQVNIVTPAARRTDFSSGAATAGEASTGSESDADDSPSDVNFNLAAQAKARVAAPAQLRTAPIERLLAALQAPGGMGFHNGRPVAAIVIFRYCLHSRAFQAYRTAIFDRIVQVIEQQVERGREDNSALSYWLSTTVTLWRMINTHLKPPAKPAGAAMRPNLGALFEASAGGDSAAAPAAPGGIPQAAAKYPALLFERQLDAFARKIFPMIGDNVIEKVQPLLDTYIAMPQAGSNKHPATSRTWSPLLMELDEALGTVKANHLPEVLVQALFKQLFRFANVHFFNETLLRRECCSFTNGAFVEAGLGRVEAWIKGAGETCMADSWEELAPLRQGVGFLTMPNKPAKSLEQIQQLCPMLSVGQLYRISSMSRLDDLCDSHAVSSSVLARMKEAVVASSSSRTFMLDNTWSRGLEQEELPSKAGMYDLIPVPSVLAEGNGAASFAFLEQELRLVPS
ncbi:hypothetical protein HYH03_017738 [Edaphochlamys debaryana]|uniref:Dilute domain-containing protein n=1 Tax=Edaphochlamys debaryana TaxID=47281 RepID=A0A836BNL3_9CHLO|nr:hypothetical protein HYH03_017738 [Edaphochlamys debaryana]|eukprot:KAG2483386.1 hypothetical protein HYH03_017738 [Edaphochlamys debaryana]